MTVLAALSSPASTLSDDLTPDSGLALRRWTPDEFRQMAYRAVFGPNKCLDLADGEIVMCDTGDLHLFTGRAHGIDLRKDNHAHESHRSTA